jgi:hypothetical protein
LTAHSLDQCFPNNHSLKLIPIITYCNVMHHFTALIQV